jgi:hypothetical protein
MPAALIGRRRRIAALVGMWLLTSASYLAVAALSAALHPLMPLIPASVLVYLTLGPFTLLAAWYAEDAAFRRLLIAALLAMLVAYAIFLVLPRQIEREALPDGHPWRPLFTLLRSLEGPLNTCPSLHVVYASLVLAIRRWSWPVCLWGGAIILSTLTTRQHVAVDVASGVGLAGAAWWLAGRRLHRWTPG